MTKIKRVSLRKHNRGKENNKKTREKRKAQHERGTTTARTKQGDPHKKLHSPPPPKESEALCGEAAHETNERHKQQPTTERRGRALNEQRQPVHCIPVRELRANRKRKQGEQENQEKTRFPSTALLAHETRAKTVLILERRESPELLSQPVDDAAVAARLVLDEKYRISHQLAVRTR